MTTPPQDYDLDLHTIRKSYSGSEPQRWIWRYRIPHQRVTLVSGPGGVGKTRVLASTIVHFLHQEEYPDGQPVEEEPGSILFITTETKDSELAKIFIDQGLEEEELDSIIIASYLQRGEDDRVVFSLDRDVPKLEKAIAATHAKIVVIDPLREFHTQKDVDSYAIRQLMVRLDMICERTGVAIIAVIHWNKDEKKGRSNRMAGSHQYRDAVRSVIIVEEDEKSKVRHFVQDKMNLGPEPVEMVFTLEEPDGYISWARAEEVESTVAPAVLTARKWLVDNLTPSPLPVAWIESHCDVSRRSLFRAKASMRGSVFTIQLVNPETSRREAYWDIACSRNLEGLLYTGGLKTHAPTGLG